MPAVTGISPGEPSYHLQAPGTSSGDQAARPRERAAGPTVSSANCGQNQLPANRGARSVNLISREDHPDILPATFTVTFTAAGCGTDPPADAASSKTKRQQGLPIQVPGLLSRVPSVARG